MTGVRGDAEDAVEVDHWRGTVPPVALGLATFLLCVVFFSAWPTEWDSVQLTSGVDRFDIRMGSPHPPGYWLYIAAGRLVRALTPLDAHRSLQVLSALAAAGTAVLVYLVGRAARNRWLGIAAGAVIATSPFLLFYGATAASYAFDALLAVALLLLALKASPGSRHGFYATGLLGLGSGLRPSAVVALAPIVLWALFKSVRSPAQLVAAAGAGAVGLAAWMVPMFIEQPGGMTAYIRFSRAFYRSGFTTNAFTAYNAAHAAAYTLAATLPVLPLALLGTAAWRGRRLDQRGAPRRSREAPLVLAVSSAFAFGFLALGYFGKAGYVLSYLPAIVLLALLPLASAGRGLRRAATALVVVVCLVQMQRFVSAEGVMPKRFVNEDGLWFTETRYGAPFPLTHEWMRHVDRDTDALASLADALSPQRDVLVFPAGNGGYRFRHACFTMPEFRIHYLRDGADFYRCEDGRMLTEADGVIEVPPGGRAVFILDFEPPEAAGQPLSKQAVASGRTVWIAAPGVSLYGPVVREAPVAPVKEPLP